MSKPVVSKIILLIPFLFAFIGVQSQDDFASKEVKPSLGLGIGVFNYFGDVNSIGNQTSLLNQFGYEFHVARKLSNYSDLGFSFLTGTIIGNERSIDRNLNFRTDIYSISFYGSFNFDYLLNWSDVISPYVTIGFESFEYNNKGDLVDANGSLSRTEANAWLNTFDGCSQIEFFEQPLAVADRNGLLALAESNSLALALDESLFDVQIAEEFLADGWPGYFVFKPTLCPDWREMETFLRNEPTRCVVSSVFESPFGFEAVLRSASLVETVAGIGVNAFFLEDDFSLHTIDMVLQPGEVDITQLEELWRSI